MVYDCFSFFNELDVLEIRLNVLKDVVDRFVLVEATRRHSGEPKELFYLANRDSEALRPFKDRIIHIVVDDEPEIPSDCPRLIASWAYENWQRNAVLRGLKGLSDSDVLLISDLDEIPDPELVRRHAGQEGVFMFEHLPAYYYFNFISMHIRHWYGTKMLNWKTFRDPATYEGMPRHIPMPEFVNRGPTPTRVRMLRKHTTVLKGGWHFSYSGGAEKVLLKMKSIADWTGDESNRHTLEDVRNRIAAGRDPYGRTGRFYAVPFDGRFPAYLRDNADRFSQSILPCEGVPWTTRLICLAVRLKVVLTDFTVSHTPSWCKPFVYAVYRRLVRNPMPLMKDQLKVR